MPSAADHHSSSLVKLLYVGNSSVGKTGSLLSLIQAGYKIGMVDMDNGIDVLINLVKHHCPDKLGNLKYVTARDTYAIDAAGRMTVQGQAKAFAAAMKFTQKWDDDTVPSKWGPEWFYVLDTLSTMGNAAHAWAQAQNPLAKEPRTWVNGAQRAIESYVAGITGPEFNTNIIVITHLAEGPKAGSVDLSNRLYAASIGKALGPSLGKYFNNLILAETIGQGAATKRTIKTVPTGMVDLKTSAPFSIPGDLPLESGLATLIQKIKGTKS